MASFPRFRLYNSTGLSLIYEFDNVLNWGDSPFEDPRSFATHTSLRGQGEINSDGADIAWDLELNFLLIADDYEALVALMNALPTTIVKNTKYILRIDLTNATTKDLKVKRLTPIRFPSGTRKKKVITFADGFITLRVGTWS